MDARLIFQGRTADPTEPGMLDLVLDAGDLAADRGLATAVIISLFTDARARPDDRLPDPTGGRRGWWGDAAPAEVGGRVLTGDRIGSRLWLLAREKTTPETVARARTYIREALAWMARPEVGLARAIDVEVERQGLDRLAARITIHRPDGAVETYAFDQLWQQQEAA